MADSKTTEISNTSPAAPAVPAIAEAAPTLKPAEGAAPVVPPAAAPEASTAEGTKFAAQFAALSRKEREHMKAMEAAKPAIAEAKAFADAKKALNTPNGVLKALDLLGVSYEQLTQAMIGRAQKPKTEEQIAELNARLQANEDAAKKQAEDAKAAHIAEATNEFKGQIKNFVETNAEKYELIKESQSENLVFEVIELEYKRSAAEDEKPRIMSIDEACQKVEDHLNKQLEKIVNLNKVKNRFNPKPIESAPVATGAKKKESQTLTNADATAEKMVRSRVPTTSELISEAAKQLKFS